MTQCHAPDWRRLSTGAPECGPGPVALGDGFTGRIAPHRKQDLVACMHMRLS